MSRLVKWGDLSARLVYMHTLFYRQAQAKNNMLTGNEWICESFTQSPTLPSLSLCAPFPCCIYDGIFSDRKP